MDSKHIYELPSAKEGIKLLLDNPTMLIRKINNKDCNRESKIFTDKDTGLLQEEVFEREFCSENCNFKYYPVNIMSKEKHWISGYDEGNFFYVCNRIINSFDLNVGDLHELYLLIKWLDLSKRTTKLIDFMKDVYWVYLRNMIDEDNILNEKEKEFLDDLLCE